MKNVFEGRLLEPMASSSLRTPSLEMTYNRRVGARGVFRRYFTPGVPIIKLELPSPCLIMISCHIVDSSVNL